MLKYISALRKVAAAVRTRDKRAVFDAILEIAALIGLGELAQQAAELWEAFEKKDWREILENVADILNFIASFSTPVMGASAPAAVASDAESVACGFENLANDASMVKSGETPEETGNPLVIIAVIGLVINIVRFIRERREKKT